MKKYQSDVTESQWQFIENIIDPDKRKRKYSMQDVLNTMLYVVKGGIQWRMIPHDLVPWQSTYYYFRKWKNNGLIEEVHDFLVGQVRLKKGKKETPTVGIVDSQSAKATNMCEENIGYDGGTLGLILTVVIHAANIHDSVGAKNVLKTLKEKHLSAIQKIFADSGYIGDLIDWVKIKLGFELLIVKRTDGSKFKILPMRWIVERTFAWLSFHRRMSKDYERLSESSVAFIQLAMVRLMLKTIHK